MPDPLVIYPIILSPGIGLQQPLKLTFISFIPSTKISFLMIGFFGSLFFFNILVAGVSFLLINLITDEMVYFP